MNVFIAYLYSTANFPMQFLAERAISSQFEILLHVSHNNTLSLKNDTDVVHYDYDIHEEKWDNF